MGKQYRPHLSVFEESTLTSFSRAFEQRTGGQSVILQCKFLQLMM